MFANKQYYGSTTVGERGQIVLPAKLRKHFRMKKGDRFIVMGTETKSCIILVKADVMTSLMSKFFGRDVQIIEKKRTRSK